MDKLKKSLKHLFAPAIVVMLVAIMGVFSPVVSVAAALRVNTMGVTAGTQYAITNLPTRSVEINTTIAMPEISGGEVKLCHAGRYIELDGDEYTYEEIGQYEWRFYANNTLFTTQVVTVTDAAYAMTMPSNVATVAPKNLDKLTLPLPSAYKVDGKAVKVEKIEKGSGNFANITVDGAVAYRLTANVSLENRSYNDQIAIDQNGLVIDMEANKTGTLRVAYHLYNADGSKLLSVLPLSNIEIKDVTADEVTFANIPSAPSVKNLAYYSAVNLTAPTADSAKVDATSFSVEAETKIFKVQCSPYSTEPKDWSAKNNDKIHTLTVEKDNDGKWVVKENGVVTNQYLEVDGLTVKVKSLGWYRFQFETTTLFGYQLDEEFDTDSVNIEQDENNTYVRYWSDSVRIYRDETAPNFAWVAQYDKTNEEAVNEMNENFSDLLDDYTTSLPMSEKPDASTTKKITVNPTQGLVLPAIFPHDNATAFADMKVTAVNIDQIQDQNGDTVSDNYVWSTEKDNGDNSKYFVYDMSKRLQISFVDEGVSRTNGNNNVVLVNHPGLYRVRITVEEKQPTYADGEKYSAGYANQKTKYMYFYVDDKFECETSANDSNSPVIEDVFQVSDVYLWEGNNFEFKKPTFSDAHTPNDAIQTDYYFVGYKGTSYDILSKLDASSNALRRVNVDLENLYIYDDDKDENTETKLALADITNGDYSKFYIYAVARNFNAMQSNLKAKMNVTTPDMQATDAVFKTQLFTGAYNDKDELAQYGYAWKRAEFNINTVDTTSAVASITSEILDAKNEYKAGQKVIIDTITADWGVNPVDGQMSVAVYKVNADNILVPVNVVNSDDEIVSSVSFKRASYTLKNLSFTPTNGKYILVVTAKNYASNKSNTLVREITIDSNDTDVEVTPLSLKPITASNYTVNETISVGESLVLPNLAVTKGSDKYIAKNRQLFLVDSNGDIADTASGNYTITVLNVNDANCISGNKFTPSQNGQYVFQYNFYLGASEDSFKTYDYVVQVNGDSSADASIRMGEDYNAKKVLWKTGVTFNGTGEQATIGGTSGTTYDVGTGDTGTDKKPAFAITLNQFTMSNYGAATDFVVDSASLFDYLEPIYKDGAITGYMYPAIAIPLPNMVGEATSSDDVEITVQKSGNSSYLVSNKKKNAGGSANKASVIDQIDGYYVFRPEGKFSADCKDNYDADTYLQATTSQSGAAGVYTVAYRTNDTSLSFNVTFGNVQNGSLSWSEGFLTYDNDDGKGKQEIANDNASEVVIEEIDGHRYVTIDMSKVYFTGNADMEDLIAQGPNPENNNDGYDQAKLAEAYYMENVKVTVSFEGGAFIDYSDWKDTEDETTAIKITEDGKFMYKFDLSKGSGTYKVNISMPNKYTASSVSASIEFTIDVDVTNKKTNLNNVWGIILIVLSVGLLAGVVYYFIKTARATRFVDAPRMAKNKIKAPKANEESKKDEQKKDEVKKEEAEKDAK